MDADARATAATSTTPTATTNCSSKAVKVKGAPNVISGEKGILMQPLSVLANAGPAKAIAATTAAAIAKTDLIRLIRNLLYLILQREHRLLNATLLYTTLSAKAN